MIEKYQEKLFQVREQKNIKADLAENDINDYRGFVRNRFFRELTFEDSLEKYEEASHEMRVLGEERQSKEQRQCP